MARPGPDPEDLQIREVRAISHRVTHQSLFEKKFAKGKVEQDFSINTMSEQKEILKHKVCNCFTNHA